MDFELNIIKDNYRMVKWKQKLDIIIEYQYQFNDSQNILFCSWIARNEPFHDLDYDD